MPAKTSSTSRLAIFAGAAALVAFFLLWWCQGGGGLRVFQWISGIPISAEKVKCIHPLAWELDGLKTACRACSLSSRQSNHRIGINLRSFSFYVDSRFTDVQVDAGRDLPSLFFKNGRLRISKRINKLRILFSDWESKDLVLAGFCTFNKGALSQCRLEGDIAPGVLNRLLVGPLDASSAEKKLRFHLFLFRNRLTLYVNGHLALKTQWKMATGA